VSLFQTYTNREKLFSNVSNPIYTEVGTLKIREVNTE